MQTLTSMQQKIDHPVCLLVGNYDGIHLGHQSIIRQARQLAERDGLRIAVSSFEPHPLRILAPQRAPKLLHTPEQKSHLLNYYEVDYYVVEQFDEAYSKLSPEAFIQRLTQRIPFRYLLVGFNFRFGHKRAGNFETLKELGPRYGFQPIMVQATEDQDGPISSSRIRTLVAEGKTLEAARLLGRPYFLEGRVVQGRQLGRKIKSPTANFSAANQLLPRFGVYASWARAEGCWYRAITNIGAAPTVERGELLVETMLFDFRGDLYNKNLVVCLGDFIRPETRFDHMDQLKQQIQADINTRKALADVEPPELCSEPTPHLFSRSP